MHASFFSLQFQSIYTKNIFFAFNGKGMSCASYKLYPLHSTIAITTSYISWVCKLPPQNFVFHFSHCVFFV